MEDLNNILIFEKNTMFRTLSNYKLLSTLQGFI